WPCCAGRCRAVASDYRRIVPAAGTAAFARRARAYEWRRGQPDLAADALDATGAVYCRRAGRVWLAPGVGRLFATVVPHRDHSAGAAVYCRRRDADLDAGVDWAGARCVSPAARRATSDAAYQRDRRVVLLAASDAQHLRADATLLRASGAD